MEMQNPSAVPLNHQNRNTVMSENPSLGKRIRRYFRDYCEGSSLIGFRYLGERRSRGERILWFLIIALSIAVSLYYVIEIYNKYVENPFIVNLATRETPIFTVPFPAITICPTVKASKTTFDFTKNVNLLWDNKTLPDDELKYVQYLSLLCESVDTTYREKLPPNETFTDDFFAQMEYLSPSLSNILSSCEFMGVDFECEDIFEPVVVDDGICFTFNMLNRDDIYRPNVYHHLDYLQKQNRTEWTIENGYPKGAGTDVFPSRAQLAGADNALMISFKQEKKEIDYMCVQDSIGFSVLLHTPQTLPQLKKSFFSVPLDTSVHAIVKPNMMTTSNEVKNYKLKDRKCYFTEERYLKYFKVYTPENCQLECLTNHTLEICGCVNFFMPRENTTDICGNSMYECMEHAQLSMKIQEIQNQLSEDFSTENSCNCMPICTSLSYNVETTRAPFPWRQMFTASKSMREYGTEEIAKTMHFSYLSIYFGSDTFIQMERTELYGFFDLMSNIGGILGLFNGFALLSVVEIVYYITVRLWCNYRLNDDFLES